jgi:hypothetical protein
MPWLSTDTGQNNPADSEKMMTQFVANGINLNPQGNEYLGKFEVTWYLMFKSRRSVTS